MAADAKSFGIALGVNAAIATICFLFFCVMRLRRLMRKFYMPRQFAPATRTAGKPRPLPKKFLGWVGPAWASSEDELVRVAGYDAAMYIKILTFSFETLVWVSLWALIIALPTNLVGKEVARLSSTGNVPTSPYTYWVPSPPPPNAPPAPGDQSVKNIKAPDFFAPTPPAPAGLEWWVYNAGVPPLPQPADVLGGNYSGYQWRYNAKYSAESYTFSQLDKVTMSNVSGSSRLLWIHAICCYFIVWVVLRGLWRYSKAATALHLRYVSSAPRGAASHSVLVTDIPGSYSGTVTGFVPRGVRESIVGGAAKSGIPRAVGRGTNLILPSSISTPRASRASNADEAEQARLPTQDGVAAAHADGRRPADVDAWASASERLAGGGTLDELVRAEYEELYPGEVAAVHVVRRTAALDPLVSEYEAVLRDLEDLLDDYASQKARGKAVTRKTTRVLGARHGSWGRQHYPGWLPVKTDLMGWHTARLAELRRRILQEQAKCGARPSPTAFVTFSTRRAQTVASNSLQHPDVGYWHVSAAPYPGDVIWENVRHRAWQRQARFAVVWAAFVALALFYTIPVGAVQAIIEVNRLSAIPGFKQLVSVTFIRSLIEAILPGLVLNIFLALLPLLLSLMNKQQGMVAWTQVDFGVVLKYFIFLVISVFLGSFIGGTLFNQFTQWKDNPGSAVTILGSAAPLSSIFWMTYLQLQALASLPLSFLRLFGLLLYWLRSKLAATPRARARVWAQQRYKYGPQLPRHVLILFVALVFSVINPLVPALGILYFAVALLTERYNMLYVYAPLHDSGGKMWAPVFGQVITAVFFFEAVMVALLAIKRSFAAILIGPLIAVTFVFWHACRPVFERPMTVVSVRTATDLDHNDRLAEEEVPLESPQQQQAQQAQWGGGPRERETYLAPAMDFDEGRHAAVLAEAAEMELVLQGKKELQLADDAAEAGPEADVETGGECSSADSQALASSQRRLVPLLSQEQASADSASEAHLRNGAGGGTTVSQERGGRGA